QLINSFIKQCTVIPQRLLKISILIMDFGKSIVEGRFIPHLFCFMNQSDGNIIHVELLENFRFEHKHRLCLRRFVYQAQRLIKPAIRDINIGEIGEYLIIMAGAFVEMMENGFRLTDGTRLHERIPKYEK